MRVWRYDRDLTYFDEDCGENVALICERSMSATEGKLKGGAARARSRK